MRNFKNYALLFLSLTVLMAYAATSNANTLLKSDKRIKTFVYNQNEVYTVVARNGFQTALEFAEDEKIDTISLGDPVGWRITNSGRRVFVKPVHKKGVTNLSVFTNKRAYQFELVASGYKDERSNHSYIVRFFYPSSEKSISADIDRSRNSLRPISATAIPRVPVAPVAAPPQPAFAAPAAPKPAPVANQQLNNFNFNYTLSGPESIAPKKIFDDGKSTYFEYLQPNSDVSFSIVNAQGKETPLAATAKKTANGVIFIVNNLARKFAVKRGKQTVHVYNEQVKNLPSTSLVTQNSGARF